MLNASPALLPQLAQGSSSTSGLYGVLIRYTAVVTEGLERFIGAQIIKHNISIQRTIPGLPNMADAQDRKPGEEEEEEEELDDTVQYS